MLFRKSVNIQKFKTYLDELRRRYFVDDICLYINNLSVHKSKEVRDRMEELGIAYVFSPIYSPDYNPVEYVFSMAKREIKERRLKAIINEEQIELWDIIKESFDSINRLKIAHCC